MGRPFLPLKLSLRMGRYGPHLTYGSLDPAKCKTQTESRLVQPFLHSSQQSVPLLYNRPPPSKLPLPIGRSGPPSNTWFLGPTRVLSPNAISIGSAVFAGFTTVTDRQIYRPHLYGRTTAFCSVLFLSLPRSEGWPHHGRTFSIYLYPLSF